MSNKQKLNTNNLTSPFLVKGEFKYNAQIENKNYPLSDFTIIKDSSFQNKSIGKGAFGEIFLIKNKKDNKLYALKQINKKNVLESGASLEIIKREISIHIRITHPYIVKLYSTVEDDREYNMIMDYIPNGTLFSLIQKHHGLSENESFKYFIQVASAIQFLHYNGLAHRDIKPENILIDEKKNIKLCDFGWCVDISKGERQTFCGTYEYMAPEIVNDELYDYGIDIWSLGVLLYEMIHGYSPFRANNNCKDVMKEIFDNITNMKFEIHKKISKDCIDLMKLLLAEKDKRIKINDIFKHPWVKKFEKVYFPELYEKENEKENKKIDWGKEFEINDEKNKINSDNNYNFQNNNNYISNNNDDKKKKIKKEKKDNFLPFSDDSEEESKPKEKKDKNIISKNLKLKEKEIEENDQNKIINDEKRDLKQYVKRSKKNDINDEEVSISTGILDEKQDIELEKIFKMAENKKNNKNKKNDKEKKKYSNKKKEEIYNEVQNEIKDLHEGDEFNFLKDLNNTRGDIKRKNDPSKMLNMNFLPRDLLYEGTNYKESTQKILRTIDLVEKAQRIQEEKKEKNKKKKEEPKESFIDSLFNAFKCGQCKGS